MPDCRCYVDLERFGDWVTLIDSLFGSSSVTFLMLFFSDLPKSYTYPTVYILTSSGIWCRYRLIIVVCNNMCG